jgi:hypothetical protein
MGSECARLEQTVGLRNALRACPTTSIGVARERSRVTARSACDHEGGRWHHWLKSPRV